MRRLVALASLPLAFATVACKRRPPEEAPAAPVAARAAAAPVEEALDALTPPPPPDLMRRADTANGHAGGPRQAELDAAQADAQARVQACLDGLPATAFPGGVARLGVRYVVGNEGKARDVSVDGGADATAQACARTAIETASFPRFEGPAVGNAFMLTYTRPQPTTARDLGPTR